MGSLLRPAEFIPKIVGLASNWATFGHNLGQQCLCQITPAAVVMTELPAQSLLTAHRLLEIHRIVHQLSVARLRLIYSALLVADTSSAAGVKHVKAGCSYLCGMFRRLYCVLGAMSVLLQIVLLGFALWIVCFRWCPCTYTARKMVPQNARNGSSGMLIAIGIVQEIAGLRLVERSEKSENETSEKSQKWKESPEWDQTGR